MSLPAWGVRVEILQSDRYFHFVVSLPAWGVRVEISRRDSPEWIPRHSPHGECGLKYTPFDRKPVDRTSLPAWGVRVEIGSGTGIAAAPSSLPVWGVRVEIWPGSSAMAAPQSLPAWGVRVEILNASTRRSGSYRSLPAWGVRVEMANRLEFASNQTVTPRMGSAG